ncbi:nucleoplasmin-like protein [Culicoides brevitarsis]|uniref:nucleoplasmin-like protein n=1 Tax=Culicoides brevitarsis TaxID=469753 RepID=UPI00307C7475
MVDEFFYGFTLKGEKAEHQWTGHKTADDEDEHAGEVSSKLILKRALLGPDAGTEQCVVEVETMSMSEMVKVPVCVLKVGEERQVNLGELEFFDAPVTFRLTHGKGPVHILGQHLQQDEEEQMVDMEEFADDDEEDSENEIHAEDNGDENPKKKMKLSKKKGKGDKK